MHNNTKMNHGLSDIEVLESRRRHGNNVLTPAKRVSLWKLYIEKYDDQIIKILLIAAAISFGLAFFSGEYIETIGIFVAIILATTIGFYFERDAARKFGVLTSLGEESEVKVRRNGKVTLVRRRDIVVGDIVLVETGDEVPADGILVSSVSLQIDESSLTGEPITDKRTRCDADASTSKPEAAEAYPEDILLRSTMVMNGRGEMRVTSVGDATEIGRVARSTAEPMAVKTPLNAQLERLAVIISSWGIGISVVTFLIFLVHNILTDSLWHTSDYVGMATVVLRYFMMAVTLIVMAVPEGLPMAITLSLALNMRRMLNTNNLVRKLHACETMGAVNVICTDKTGTLTQNRMEVVAMAEYDDSRLIEAIALNTTAYIDSDDRGIGNPTEVALLRWLAAKGIDYRQLRDDSETLWQQPFSTEHKYMATLVRVKTSTGSERLLFVKGAPEIIMSKCAISEPVRSDILSRLHDYQSKAMRTLALAVVRWDSDDMPSADKTFGSGTAALTLQAIAAISDPVRADVPQSVETCLSAGIYVKIVTGDTSATAIEVARQIGILTDTAAEESDDKTFISGERFSTMTDEEALDAVDRLKVMYRARPADKQRLVQMLQRRGLVVAVTGDGTNDAPALHHAHVGLSLGSGTSVAKEASDMTLLDDSFRSIVHAVMWGRSLYANIQRFLFFQLTVNVSALLLVLAGSFVGTEMPLTVTQILWVNLIMDTFAALAISSLPPSREVMKQKPRRRDEFIITPSIFRAIMTVGLSQFVVMFAMLLYCLHVEPGVQLHELSIFFTTFVMLQVWNMFNAKRLGTQRSAFSNFADAKGLHLVLLLVIVGQWLIVTFGGRMFRVEPLSFKEWIVIIVATSTMMWVGEAVAYFKKGK